MLPLSRMPVEAVRQVTTLLFDLDGTFVTEDNLESETYRSLERVRKNGIKTIAVTEDQLAGVISWLDGGQLILLLERMGHWPIPKRGVRLKG